MNVIVLTGGTSKRFGSDKSQAEIGGSTLIEILASNLKDHELIIVGPKSSIDARYIREEPLFSGPLAAIGAGLELVQSELVGIFATDMPFAPRLIDKLVGAIVSDAALPVDADGVVQPLAGVYKTESLRRVLMQFKTLADQSVKSLISKMEIDLVSNVDTELLLDIDTEADLMQVSKLQSRLAQ